MRWLDNCMLKIINKIINGPATKVLDTVDTVVSGTGATIEHHVSPVRNSVLKRFPVLFSLLTTFGVAATFLGFEQLILKSNLLDKYPELILALGVIILVFTGKIYKKLS